MKPTRKQIERAANLIRFTVPLNGNIELNHTHLSGWTPKGLREIKWPSGFSPAERKLIRTIAKQVIFSL